VSSIQRRLTIWLVAATVLSSLAAGLWLYTYVRTALLNSFDATLATKAHAISALLHVDRDGSIAMDFESELMPEYLVGPNAEYYMIVGPHGALIDRSPSLEQSYLFDPNTKPAVGIATDISLPDHRAGRMLATTTVPDFDDVERATAYHPPTVWVAVARDRSEMDRVLAALAGALVISAGVLALGGAIAVRLIVHYGLRPVNKLAEIAATIGPETLEYRFETARLPSELAPICGRFNDLLERLDQAFKRERRLNADIAHELRTPIAELRSLTDVATRWPCDSAKSAEYLRDAGDIARRMASLVETLLAMARGHSGQLRPHCEPVELSALLTEVIDVHRDKSNRELNISFLVPDDLAVVTDREMLRRIIDNVLSNAFEYAPEGGRIRCEARIQSRRCELAIGSSNDSLTPTDLPRLCEPFWRKDAARSGDAHSGLGLSLVAEYAKQLGIAVTPRLASADWFEMILTIPSPTAAAVMQTS